MYNNPYNQTNNTYNQTNNPYQTFNDNPNNYQPSNNNQNMNTSSSSSSDEENLQKHVKNNNQIQKQILNNYNSSEGSPFNYKDPNVRLNFIRKVYLILSAQLLCTFIFVLLAFTVPEFRVFQLKHQWLLWVCVSLTVILIYALVCYTSVARSVPLNYILLFIFTVAESYSVAFIASQYDAQTVVIAAGLTAAIVVGLTLYAIFTKTDFTVCGGILVVCMIALIIGGIIGIFIRNKWLHLVLSILGVIVFGIYLVFDTQLTIGKNQRKYSIDDYIIAALNLYIDIIQIFLELLKIIAIANNN
jgi:FtsH-binding integral membrane protein